MSTQTITPTISDDAVLRQAATWRDELGKVYAPHRLVFAIPADVADLDPALADKRAGDTTRAYVCRGSTCSAPIESLEGLAKAARARLNA